MVSILTLGTGCGWLETEAHERYSSPKKIVASGVFIWLSDIKPSAAFAVSLFNRTCVLAGQMIIETSDRKVMNDAIQTELP